jgi:hypothetical protein
MGSPPAPPILILPENNATTDNTPTFQWSSGGGLLENYRLEVDNDPDFSTTIDNLVFDNTTTSYTVPLADSYPEDNYYWRVWALNQWGENVSENTWTFEVALVVLPGKPVLLSPENNENVTQTVTFEWVIGSNADNHRIEIDNDGDWTNGVVENENLGPVDNSYQTALPYGSYRWRVWAVNESGENVSENTWQFTVVAIWNPMDGDG